MGRLIKVFFSGNLILLNFTIAMFRKISPIVCLVDLCFSQYDVTMKCLDLRFFHGKIYQTTKPKLSADLRRVSDAWSFLITSRSTWQGDSVTAKDKWFLRTKKVLSAKIGLPENISLVVGRPLNYHTEKGDNLAVACKIIC